MAAWRYINQFIIIIIILLKRQYKAPGNKERTADLQICLIKMQTLMRTKPQPYFIRCMDDPQIRKKNQSAFYRKPVYMT